MSHVFFMKVHGRVYGDYRSTARTSVCGTENEGSIPSSRPDASRKASLAQLVEHLALNQMVGGSSPPRCTEKTALRVRFCYLFRIVFVCMSQKDRKKDSVMYGG